MDSIDQDRAADFVEQMGFRLERAIKLLRADRRELRRIKQVCREAGILEDKNGAEDMVRQLAQVAILNTDSLRIVEARLAMCELRPPRQEKPPLVG